MTRLRFRMACGAGFEVVFYGKGVGVGRAVPFRKPLHSLRAPRQIQESRAGTWSQPRAVFGVQLNPCAEQCSTHRRSRAGLAAEIQARIGHRTRGFEAEIVSLSSRTVCDSDRHADRTGKTENRRSGTPQFFPDGFVSRETMCQKPCCSSPARGYTILALKS